MYHIEKKDKKNPSTKVVSIRFIAIYKKNSGTRKELFSEKLARI
jgi:hypothetical protein